MSQSQPQNTTEKESLPDPGSLKVLSVERYSQGYIDGDHFMSIQADVESEGYEGPLDIEVRESDEGLMIGCAESRGGYRRLASVPLSDYKRVLEDKNLENMDKQDLSRLVERNLTPDSIHRRERNFDESNVYESGEERAPLAGRMR